MYITVKDYMARINSLIMDLTRCQEELLFNEDDLSRELTEEEKREFWDLVK